MRDALGVAKHRLAREIDSHSALAFKPIPADPWVISSLLQKSIRRGETEIAQRAAFTFFKLKGPTIWRRLMVIPFEDIGIGSVDALTMTACEESRRLEEIPGIGPIVATALVAEIGDWGAFRSGRNLAAWIGLVPKQHSTGGKERLGSITKQGNRYLRWLLVAGAMAVIRYARQHGSKRPWLTRIMDRRPAKVAAVALANKIARMAWAIMVRGERYREPKLLLAA